MFLNTPNNVNNMHYRTTHEYPNSHSRTFDPNYQYNLHYQTRMADLFNDPSWSKDSSTTENDANMIESSQDQEQEFDLSISFDDPAAEHKQDDESISEEDSNVVRKLQDQIQDLQLNVEFLTKQVHDDAIIKENLQKRLKDLEKKIEDNPSIHTDEELGDIFDLVRTFIFPRLKIIPQEELDNEKGECITNIVKQYKKEPNMSDHDISYNWKLIRTAVLKEMGKYRNTVKAQFHDNYKGNVHFCSVLVHCDSSIH